MTTLLKDLRQTLLGKQQPIRFTGDYKCWEDAERDSTGYDSPEILNKTRSAMLKVKSGEAGFERDSVTFATMQFEFPLLAGLLRAAGANDGRLSVLDFGGALGTTYFQCRNFLAASGDLRWSVVDQPAHVACGQAEFANEQLRFYPTVAECMQVEKPTVLLLLSVLQYLPDPYRSLQELLSYKIPYVVIERTAFIRSGRDRLTLQHVPSYIYAARLPAWFLSEPKLRAIFNPDYVIVCEYPSGDKPGLGDETCYKGFHFELRNTGSFIERSAIGSKGHSKAYRCTLCDSSRLVKVRRFEMVALRREWLSTFGFDPFVEFEPLPEILDQYQCAVCQLEFFSPQHIGGAEFYRKLSQADWYYQESMWEFDEAIKRLARNSQVRTVLEIGCGKGHFLEKISSAYRTFGTELNENAAAACREKGLNVITGDHAVFGDKFDAIVGFEVLEHIARPGDFLRRLTEALPRGGTLILAVPNPESYLMEFDHVLLDMPPHHATRWPRATFEFVATKLHLDLLDVVNEPLRFVHYQGYLHERATRNRRPARSWSAKVGHAFSRLAYSAVEKTMAPLAYRCHKRSLVGQTHLAEFRKR